MKNIKLLAYSIIIIFTASCNDTINESIPPPPEPTISELRNESTLTLTSGAMKTWKISEASLANNGNNIDISNNFNVIDDEFIFAGTGENGTLEWRKGFDIKTNATTNKETLLDNYVSPINTTFSYQDESSTVVEVDFGSCIFKINTDKTITATITNPDSSVLNFKLTHKTPSQQLSPPQNGLNFTTAFTFQSNAIAGFAPGMIGSNSDNSFFIVTREGGLNNGSANPERVIKFDIGTNSISQKLFFQNDFVSKQLHIINNKLMAVGAQYINKYETNIINDPISTSHGKALSRFGVSVLNNDIYLIGGDLNDMESDKIFKWNINNQSISQFATLPVPKSGARGTIINDNLYVFGGSDKFFGDNPTNSIYKVNINTPTQIGSFQMNKVIDFTFVQKQQNLIFVAGQIIVRDNSGTALVPAKRESTIGVFNTLDDSYQELTTNLTNSSGSETIHQMCVFNNKMYIIYGDTGTNNGGQFREWNVLVSDLN